MRAQQRAAGPYGGSHDINAVIVQDRRKDPSGTVDNGNALPCVGALIPSGLYRRRWVELCNYLCDVRAGQHSGWRRSSHHHHLEAIDLAFIPVPVRIAKLQAL